MNKYRAACAYCGKLVKAYEGRLINVGSQVKAAHVACAENPYGKKKEKDHAPK